PQSLSGEGQGLTSGFALNNNGVGAVYQSSISSGAPCASTYIIYVANNANNSGSNGQAAYESTVANASPALAATALLDTWTDEWTYFRQSRYCCRRERPPRWSSESKSTDRKSTR